MHLTCFFHLPLSVCICSHFSSILGRFSSVFRRRFLFFFRVVPLFVRLPLSFGRYSNFILHFQVFSCAFNIQQMSSLSFLTECFWHSFLIFDCLLWRFMFVIKFCECVLSQAVVFLLKVHFMWFSFYPFCVKLWPFFEPFNILMWCSIRWFWWHNICFTFYVSSNFCVWAEAGLKFKQTHFATHDRFDPIGLAINAVNLSLFTVPCTHVFHSKRANTIRDAFSFCLVVCFVWRTLYYGWRSFNTAHNRKQQAKRYKKKKHIK